MSAELCSTLNSSVPRGSPRPSSLLFFRHLKSVLFYLSFQETNTWPHCSCYCFIVSTPSVPTVTVFLFFGLGLSFFFLAPWGTRCGCGGLFHQFSHLLPYPFLLEAVELVPISFDTPRFHFHRKHFVSSVPSVSHWLLWDVVWLTSFPLFLLLVSLAFTAVAGKRLMWLKAYKLLRVALCPYLQST